MRWPIVGIFVPALMMAAAAPAAAQGTGTISGIVVTEATTRPLAAARVTVQGTERSATTGANGRYTITGVPAGIHSVSAQTIGYGIQVAQGVTVAPGETETVNFQLAVEGALQLEGVVAVGYGTQRRRDVTGSVSSINVDDVQTVPVTSVDQVLQGRAAGVQVVQNNGAPGGGVSVRIRGTNSITANSEPLYVIDGVPAFVGSGSRNANENPLADISPQDIESIEILKDASATAIYGSRGANGVVLVTTKRGRRGENRVELESSYGMQEITRTMPVLNGWQWAEMHNEARVNAGMKPLFTAEEIAAFGEGTDWQEEIFRSAPVQTHGVTVSGGDERSRYMVSGNLFDQQGTVIGSEFRRYSARLNLDREVSDRFRVGNSLTMNRIDAESTNTDIGPRGGIVTLAQEFAPVVPVRDEEGNYTLSAPVGPDFPNPVASALEITDSRIASRIVGNVFAEYDLTSSLQLRSSVGGNALFERGTFYAPRTVQQGAAANGEAEATRHEMTELVNDNLVTYRGTLREGHDLDFTGGFTYQRHHSDVVRAGASNFATDATRAGDLGAGAVVANPFSFIDEWTLLSWLGRANYSLLDRYLFTVTARYDGSSKFGEENKWGLFPSAAFAWRLSDEPFMGGIDWLSDAKLRVSWGRTGNQEIGTYASLARLATFPYVLGTTPVITYGPAGRAPNPALRWESTRQVNAGFDLGLWDNRVVLVADVYSGVTDDLLLEVALPTTSGFSSQLQNIGSVKNRGVELAVNTVNVERASFSWHTRLNISTNRNEVVALGGPDRLFPANPRGRNNFEGGDTHIVQVGEELGTFYGYRTNGIWQMGEDWAGSGDPFAAPGEWKFVDTNGDGKINTLDRTIIGDANPAFYGGITNNFTFGAFTLDLFLQGSYGNEVINGPAIYNRSLTSLTNEHAMALDRWTPENPSNTVPRANLNRNRKLLDVYMEDASYLRVQNLTLGYTLPAGVVPGSDRARVYVSGQNLWLLTDYKGYDPEVNSYGGDPALRGVDFGMYPRSRVLNAGVNLTF